MELMRTGEIPFLRILIPLVLGIFIGYQFESSILIFFTAKWLVLWLFIAFIFLIIFYSRWQLYNSKFFIGTLLFLLIFLIAYIRTIQVSEKLDQDHFSKSVHDLIIATVNSEPKVTSDILRFEAAVTKVIAQEKALSAKGRLLVAVKLDDLQSRRIVYGTRLLIPSNYKLIEAPRNPSEFDYKQYLSNKAIYHQVFIDESQAKILQQRKEYSLMAYAIESRLKLVDRFSRFIKDKDAVAIASTLILGYRADLSKEIVQAYSSTGTMHVLSVSGMHVGIIFIILAFLLSGMDRSNNLKIIKAILIIVLIFTYTLITGLSVAACRAALMISFLIIGKALNRNYNSYNLLAISAFMLLIFNPLFLVDIGFQLSYLAVLGLIYLYPKIYFLYYSRKWVLDRIWSYSALSFSAQIATFPIIMYNFHQFPLYFLISNLIIVVPIAIVMYLGVVFILIPIDPVAQHLGWLLEHCIFLANFLVFQIENLPGSAIKGIWLEIWEYILIYVLIILLIFSFSSISKTISKSKRSLLLSVIVVCILISVRGIKRILLDRDCRVVLFSLKKNYAIGLMEGRTVHVITDLKRSDKAFLFSIQPYLEKRQTRNTNLLPINGSNLETRSTFVDGNFIQFRNWKMFVLDKNIILPSDLQIEVNTVLVRNNSLKNISTLTKVIRFKEILFDYSNHDANIRRWVLQSKQLNVKYYDLKKKSSRIINL